MKSGRLHWFLFGLAFAIFAYMFTGCAVSVFVGPNTVLPALIAVMAALVTASAVYGLVRELWK